MSLLNVYISSKTALIAVDTNAVNVQSREAYEISKLIPLVHTNIVVGIRGVNKLLLEVFAPFFMMPAQADYDMLAAWLPPNLEAGFENYVRDCMQHGIAEKDLREVELVMVGWSAQRAEMAGVRLSRNRTDRAFTVKKIDRWHIAPNAGWNSGNPPPIPSTRAIMEQVAREQVAHIRKTEPGQSIGGRLLVAELTRINSQFKTWATWCDVGRNCWTDRQPNQSSNPANYGGTSDVLQVGFLARASAANANFSESAIWCGTELSAANMLACATAGRF